VRLFFRSHRGPEKGQFLKEGSAAVNEDLTVRGLRYAAHTEIVLMQGVGDGLNELGGPDLITRSWEPKFRGRA
jgi:hypothetical protein